MSVRWVVTDVRYQMTRFFKYFDHGNNYKGVNSDKFMGLFDLGWIDKRNWIVQGNEPKARKLAEMVTGFQSHDLTLNSPVSYSEATRVLSLDFIDTAVRDWSLPGEWFKDGFVSRVSIIANKKDNAALSGEDKEHAISIFVKYFKQLDAGGKDAVGDKVGGIILPEYREFDISHISSMVGLPLRNSGDRLLSKILEGYRHDEIVVGEGAEDIKHLDFSATLTGNAGGLGYSVIVSFNRGAVSHSDITVSIPKAYRKGGWNALFTAKGTVKDFRENDYDKGSVIQGMDFYPAENPDHEQRIDLSPDGKENIISGRPINNSFRFGSEGAYDNLRRMEDTAKFMRENAVKTIPIPKVYPRFSGVSV